MQAHDVVEHPGGEVSVGTRGREKLEKLRTSSPTVILWKDFDLSRLHACNFTTTYPTVPPSPNMYPATQTRWRAGWVQLCYPEGGDGDMSSDILLQTPAMLVPFGPEGYQHDDPPSTLKLSFTQELADPTGHSSAFLAKLRELDRWMLKMGVARDLEWFGRKMDECKVISAYDPIVDECDRNYPPVVKLNIPTFYRKVGGVTRSWTEYTMFDENRKRAATGTRLDTLVPGTVVKAIVKLGCVGFPLPKRQSYGIALELVQILIVSRPPHRQRDFAFVPDC